MHCKENNNISLSNRTDNTTAASKCHINMPNISTFDSTGTRTHESNNNFSEESSHTTEHQDTDYTSQQPQEGNNLNSPCNTPMHPIEPSTTPRTHRTHQHSTTFITNETHEPTKCQKKHNIVESNGRPRPNMKARKLPALITKTVRQVTVPSKTII
mmetsp:Transcript_33141/g.47045  ORF Transcript_33141/g.47045 Transcript_33141/m.47045 type:complete len:156 (-) Transcript_33141:147-614(-)